MSVINGDVNVMNALLFGGMSPSMASTIEREHQQFLQTANPSWGAAFLNKAKQMYSAFNGFETMRMVQNALDQVQTISKPDVVTYLGTMGEIQCAQPMMQSYIMANPKVRARYHKQLCDGYSDTYVDPAPGLIGFGHTAYEQVFDGVVQMPANDEGCAHYTNYSSAWADADARVLNIHKRAAILNTYAVIDRLFDEEDRDPTSPWNAAL